MTAQDIIKIITEAKETETDTRLLISQLQGCLNYSIENNQNITFTDRELAELLKIIMAK